MSEAPLRVGLLGRGTVGGAFAGLLEGRADEIARLSGRRPEISGVLTRSQGSFEEILAGSDVIVEVMGGLDPARDHVVAALKAGVPVITANKQLVSRCGPELWEAAQEGGSQLRFEAAVAAVVPVVRVLTESLAGADIERVHGIVNGTTNFILSEMAASGAGYAEALAGAQRLGFAEADPSDDVGGGDAAAKMAILAQLAFDGWVDIDDVVFEGIEELTAEDLAYAREFDLALKLLGTAERVGDQVSVRVNPAFLYSEHPLASVNGSFNAVTIEGPDITEVTLSGPGAGGSQTASAILGDLMSIITGVPAIPAPGKSLSAAAEVVSSFYLHLEVADRPGVLARIASVLGEHGVSVKSVVQKGVGEGARLAMVTHPIREQDFMAARDAIAALDFVMAPPRVIRVIDEHFEG